MQLNQPEFNLTNSTRVWKKEVGLGIGWVYQVRGWVDCFLIGVELGLPMNLTNLPKLKQGCSKVGCWCLKQGLKRLILMF